MNSAPGPTTGPALLTVVRAPLLVGSFAHAVIGLLLGAGGLGDIVTARNVGFVVMHFSIASLGCALNSWSDQAIDRRTKPAIAAAVTALGWKLWALVAVQATVAACLIAWFFVAGRDVTALAATLGVLVAVGYSIPPVRIKGRGLLSGLPIALGLYCLPSIGGWAVNQSSAPMWFVAFVLAYASMNTGMTLVNTVENHDANTAEGIVTWSHRFGPQRLVRLAAPLTVVGVMCPVAIVVGQDDPGPLLIALAALAVAAVIAVFVDVERTTSAFGDGTPLHLEGKRFARWFVLSRYPIIALALATNV